MKSTVSTLVLFSLFLVNFAIGEEKQKYVEFIAKRGDKAEIIFKKYDLPLSKENFKLFIELNFKRTDKNLKLMRGVKYKLPIIILKTKNISHSLKQYFAEDTIPQLIQMIKEYNKSLTKKGLKKQKEETWLPLHILKQTLEKNGDESIPPIKKGKKLDHKYNSKLFEPYFGEKFKKVKKRNDNLKNYVFYLVSGHGGPDPGAIGYFEGKELHEDEYAYDITLRLAKHLHENGAKVYMITIDTVDGIRDERILETSSKELFFGGVQIPQNQKERLELCANILNDLYKKESQHKSKKHFSINIHLDSRSEEEKVDVFYYYQENNVESKLLAETLQQTFAEQYEKYQPGRGYNGTVETRNLFMLRNTLPTTVYIELGNIKNRSNQYRFVDKNNREAIAKWLSLGIIKFSKQQKKHLNNKK